MYILIGILYHPEGDNVDCGEGFYFLTLTISQQNDRTFQHLLVCSFPAH